MANQNLRGAVDGAALSDSERKISYQIATLASLLDRHSARLLGRFGLSVVDWRIIKNLYESGPRAVCDISPAVVVDKSLISRRVLLLAKQRLIECRLDERDARKRILSLTPAGTSLYRKVLPASDKRQKLLEGVLERGQRETLYLAMRKLRDFFAQDLERQSRETRQTRSAGRNLMVRKTPTRGG